MITGESNFVSKTKAATVTAGTINEEGSLRVKVSATGDDTALAGIMRLVKEAQQSISHTQILAQIKRRVGYSISLWQWQFLPGSVGLSL